MLYIAGLLVFTLAVSTGYFFQQAQKYKRYWLKAEREAIERRAFIRLISAFLVEFLAENDYPSLDDLKRENVL